MDATRSEPRTMGLTDTEAQDLLDRDEDQLYEILGMRLQATAQDVALQGQYAAEIAYDQHMGPAEDLKKIGKRMFDRLNRQAYGLVCGNGAEDKTDRDKIVGALGFGTDAAVIAITGVLVSSFGVAAVLAGVVAALIVKRFAVPALRDGHAEMCELWKEHVVEPG